MVGSPTREPGHGEPQPASGVAQVAVGSDEYDVGPRDTLGRREMHGVVAAEIMVVSEDAGSRREGGRHADADSVLHDPADPEVGESQETGS